MRYLLLLLVLVGCSNGATEPPPPPPPPPAIVQLLVADPDTGFWLGESLTLSSLIVGAVNSDGDTVAAPAVAWTIPAGFSRNGDQLTATREARGALVASLAAPAGSAPLVSGSAVATEATIEATAVYDLTAYDWVAEYRCYDSDAHMRDGDTTFTQIGHDSIIVTWRGDSLARGDQLTGGDQQPSWGQLILTLWYERETIRFWKDGVVDTVAQPTARLLTQDTLRLHLSSSINLPDLALVKTDTLTYRQLWHDGVGDPTAASLCNDFRRAGGMTLREEKD